MNYTSGGFTPLLDLPVGTVIELRNGERFKRITLSGAWDWQQVKSNEVVSTGLLVGFSSRVVSELELLSGATKA